MVELGSMATAKANGTVPDLASLSAMVTALLNKAPEVRGLFPETVKLANLLLVVLLSSATVLHGWLTIVLQCYDTVGWVMWPVKLSPKWPIMCRVGR